MFNFYSKVKLIHFLIKWYVITTLGSTYIKGNYLKIQPLCDLTVICNISSWWVRHSQALLQYCANCHYTSQPLDVSVEYNGSKVAIYLESNWFRWLIASKEEKKENLAVTIYVVHSSHRWLNGCILWQRQLLWHWKKDRQRSMPHSDLFHHLSYRG